MYFKWFFFKFLNLISTYNSAVSCSESSALAVLKKLLCPGVIMLSVCCKYTFTNILFFFAIFSHFFVHCLYVLGSPTHHIHNVNGGSHSNCISPQLSSPRRMISRCQMVLLPIYRNNCIRRYCNASPLLSATVLKKMEEISEFILQGSNGIVMA